MSEEATRWQVHIQGGGVDGSAGASAIPLTELECLELLSSVDYGRIVFSLGALPAIRPVNHLVDNGEIIIRTRLDSTLSSKVRAVKDVVVAYEVDDIDPQRRIGWSVVATGLARRITDPDRIADYEQRLHPWVAGAMDSVIGIRPEILTGFRLVS
jgi:nitroimidazol reductase NimA-like FMN-containing flavoprotein (pyridoxamine 5'-phosphate oxidase superfamily)